MTKLEYGRIRAQLDFAPTYGGALATLTLNAVTLAAALWLLFGVEGWLAFVVSQLLLAIAGFQAFGIVHECGHGSFVPNKTLNTVFGHLASILCVTPFFSWKYIHHQHHVWAGNVERDPAVVTLGRWRRTRRVPLFVRIGWRTWIPLIGASQQFVFALYPIRMWREGNMNRGKALRSAGSVLFLVATYTGLHLVWPEHVLLRNFALAGLFYLVITEMVNLPHHTDRPSFDRRLPVWEQSAVARSCAYPRVLSEVLALNFNFHVEHHIFPTLPWYRLRKARALVKNSLGSDYTESRGVRWNLANRRRDLREVALAGD